MPPARIGSPTACAAPPDGYTDWLADLKSRIHTAQQRATLAVNRELVLLYWQIGHDILMRQASQGWGAKVIERLAQDLRTAFPDMKGFSPRNLKYMRAFAEAWPEAEFVQEVLAQLPWYHQLALLDKLDNIESRRWYAASPQRAGRRRFFSSDGHTIALAASLCMSRDRDALRAILEKMAPGAMEDLREVLASGSMRRSFLKALRTRVHIAGTLPEDCLDFMAVHLKWNRGATVAVVAAFMDSGDAPPSFPLERWQAFLARHPERAQDYAADLTTPRERNRMLRAVETLVPEPGVQAWLCDMAVRLAAPPAPRPAPRRRTVASEADMEDWLAATWASLRLESGPAQSAPRRRA